MDFFELVMRDWNAYLVGAVAVLFVAIEAAVPELFEKGKIGNRLEVFLPIVLCVCASTFVPGPWMPPDVVVGQKVVLGVLMGFAAYSASGVVKRYGGRYVAERVKAKLKPDPKP